MDALDYGFFKDSNGSFVPIITDRPAAPQYMLQDIKCSCEKPNKAGLLCSNCSCQKAGLLCTALCKCDASCENSHF